MHLKELMKESYNIVERINDNHGRIILMQLKKMIIIIELYYIMQFKKVMVIMVESNYMMLLK